MKVCPKCKEAKPLSDYYARAASKDGVQGYCKPCMLTINSSRYKRETAVKVPVDRSVKDFTYRGVRFRTDADEAFRQWARTPQGCRVEYTDECSTGQWVRHIELSCEHQALERP